MIITLHNDTDSANNYNNYDIINFIHQEMFLCYYYYNCSNRLTKGR